MKLSIIIPVYNEEKTLEEVVFRVQEVFNEEDYEIIIVNDGSTDNTRRVIENLDQPLVVIHHKKNYGKGKAIQSGLIPARGEYITIQDADLEYDPKNLYDLWIEAKPLSVVYGKRSNEKGYRLARLGNKILSFVCNTLFSSKLSDIYTCYKVIPADVMKTLNLESDGFEIEAEITAKLLKRKVKILEIPIAYTPRTYREGKHIRWVDGLKGIWTLLRVKIRN